MRSDRFTRQSPLEWAKAQVAAGSDIARAVVGTLSALDCAER